MRTSIVAISGDDLININETAYDMLRAILNGLNMLDVVEFPEWRVRFSFFEEKANIFTGCGEFFYERGEDLTKIPGMEPFMFSFRAPDGMGAYKSLELLRTEVAKLCVAMTQGKVDDYQHGLSQRWRPDNRNELAMMFAKKMEIERHFPITTAYK